MIIEMPGFVDKCVPKLGTDYWAEVTSSATRLRPAVLQASSTLMTEA